MVKKIRSAHFPARLTDEYTVTAVSRQTFNEVIGQISGQIFTSMAELGLYNPPSPTSDLAKKLAQQIHNECFVFYNAGGDPVGFSAGKVTDGQTFFMEWSGILPAHQRRGLYSSFLTNLIPYLKELGIERITSNHMGTNRPVLIAKLRAKFVITGVTLDERHGMLVWLTRFLEPLRQEGFKSAFSLDSF